MKQTASLRFPLRGFWNMLPFHRLTVPMPGRHVSKPVWKHVWRGDCERPEPFALAAMGRPQDWLLELGLGMGQVSGVLAKRNPGARFISYEANHALRSIVEQLHLLNGNSNVQVRSAVVAPLEQGNTRVVKLHRHFTESSLAAASANVDEVVVPVHEPATVMAEAKPDILICDIEGGEEELIPRMPLDGLRDVVIELHPHIVSRAGMARIFKAFADFGLVPRVEHSSETVVAFERVALL